MVELLDTSVWARKSHPRLRGWFSAGVIGGDLAICDVVALEILQGVNSPALFAEVNSLLDGIQSLAVEHIDMLRSRQVGALTEERYGTNARRSLNIPDLLIAACAERHGVTLVHYDRHFDLIASITRQRTRWVAERGSL